MIQDVATQLKKKGLDEKLIEFLAFGRGRKQFEAIGCVQKSQFKILSKKTINLFSRVKINWSMA